MQTPKRRGIPPRQPVLNNLSKNPCEKQPNCLLANAGQKNIDDIQKYVIVDSIGQQIATGRSGLTQ